MDPTSYTDLEAREASLLFRLFEDETTTRRQRDAAEAELREVQAALATAPGSGKAPAPAAPTAPRRTRGGRGGRHTAAAGVGA